MDIIKRLAADAHLFEGDNQYTAELDSIAKELEEKMQAIDRAIDQACAVGIKLPAAYNRLARNVGAGSYANDYPNAYKIWVSVESLKNLYNLSKEYRETSRYLHSFRQTLKNFTPDTPKK